jgi:RimJ/RimL family protein N-acetyltransferase
MSSPVAGRALLAALKQTAGADPGVVVAVGRPPIAVLRPVATRLERQRPDDVRRLTDWRNRFVTSFLTEFEATEAQTSCWLADVVTPNDRKILFMVDDAAGRTFAYMGIDFVDWEMGRGEVDAIVRGEDAPRGLMRECLLTLLGWARSQLGLREIEVRVRSDNPAVEFYRRVGFVERDRVPLRRGQDGRTTRWTEDRSAPPDVALVHMTMPERHSD